MRIAIVGPGAIGGFLGARFMLVGLPVTFIAHGASLAALRADGLRLVEADRTAHHLTKVDATSDMTAVGIQDVVLLTVKAHQVGPIARDIHAMLGPHTVLVTMENGIPWWYFYGESGPHAGTRLESADPGGLIAEALDPRRVIGAVDYAAAHHPAPNVIEVVHGNRFVLGEPDGTRGDRLRGLADLFVRAGFEAPPTPDIRAEIWNKLLINMSVNPISALTHATLTDLCRFPASRTLATAMMAEAEAVAGALGVTFTQSIASRLDGLAPFGAHKTSMLQDIEAGHRTEIEALLGSVLELGRITGVPTPVSGTAHALMRALDLSLAAATGRLRMRPA